MISSSELRFFLRRSEGVCRVKCWSVTKAKLNGVKIPVGGV
jgi:hypothetical protein